jgi:hypothetical protein
MKRRAVLGLLVAAVAIVALVRRQPTRDAEPVSALPPIAIVATTSLASASVVPAQDARWFVATGETIELAGRAFIDGKPARALDVAVRDELTSDGLLPEVHATTDETGRFVAKTPRIRGYYRVVAEGPGLAPAWATVPGDVPKNDIELRLESCKARIYGVVADASGGAIAGANVALDKVPSHATATDDGGRFELCMPPRSAKLRVEANGYGPWTKWISARGATRQDVKLMPEAGVVGTVVATSGGAPVPHAIVSLRANGDSIRDVQADETGHFEVSRIAPGPYTLEARAKGLKSHHPVDVAVFASSRANVTLAIDTRVHVRGVLLMNGAPVPRATVNVGFSATFEWATATRTDASGAFTIDDAPFGNLFVKVDDYEVESPRNLLVPETGVDAVVIVVSPKGRLEVTVTRRGEPVSDASVQLRGMLSTESSTTTSEGIATFRGLADGTYRIAAEHDSDFAVMEGIDVSRARPASVSLELAAGRQVTGHVVDELGQPVDGARVAFTPTTSTADLGAFTISGPDGAFRGGPLRGPASYRARVTRSGFELDSKGDFPRLTVPESGPVTPADLVLVVKTQDKDLSGVVVDAAGGPVQDARVIVTKPERHADVLATTFTGLDGAFSFHGLGAGPYAVKAITASGSEADVKPLTLPTDPVRITLPEVGTIQGALAGFTRTPSVMAWSVAGYEWDFHPATIADGRFTIGGLARGRYHVAASTPDSAAQATVEITGTQPVTVDLVASQKRSVHVRVRDFLAGGPLSNLRCQAAPDLGDTRSPVVVPGVAFSDANGELTLDDVPASPLYMWCLGEGAIRGGVARVPADLARDAVVTVWGLDARGKPSIDIGALGMTLADDHPFSRRVVVLAPKGAAERSGVRLEDVLTRVGDRSIEELGNGTARSYLALVLSAQKSVPITVLRSGAEATLVFKLE